MSREKLVEAARRNIRHSKEGTVPLDAEVKRVPARNYFDADRWELEMDRIFRRVPLVLGFSCELGEAHSYKALDVMGTPVLLVRGDDGEVRSFVNMCSHRGAQVVEPGLGRARRFSCPYHAWAYDLDGTCLGTPLFTPESEVPVDQRAAFDMADIKAFDIGEMGLHSVRVAEWGCLVFVCLDPDTPSIEHELGDLVEQLAGYRLDEYRLARRVEYDINADWKLIGENFMEYYHLPWVHPGLVKVSPMDSHYRWQGAGMYVGFCTWPIAANTEDGGWKGLPPVTFVDLDWAAVNKQLERERQNRHSGPIAENMLYDKGIVSAKFG